MTEQKIMSLTRPCEAYLIPSGALIQLQADTEVTLMQQLGDTFTVNVYGNLVRIDGKDADALGLPIPKIEKIKGEGPIEDQVLAQLKTVFDPEIPVNIVDLGLVYDCQFSQCKDGQTRVDIQMTLTAPGCGMGPIIANDAKYKALQVEGVGEVDVEVVLDPPWDQSRMTDAAKLALGML